MSQRCRLAVLCPALALAPLAASDPTEPAEECPMPAGSEVVVKGVRFSDGRSYAFMVTNNGLTPIRSITIGWGGPPYIERSVKTEPTSLGSPSGWKSSSVMGQDPRLPGSHAHTLISYDWIVEDDAALIEPGRSLSGFTVQLPTPREMELAWLRSRKAQGVSAEPSDLPRDPPINDRLPPQPDLTHVSFRVWQHRGRCGFAVGTVVPDRGGNARDNGGSLDDSQTVGR